MCNKRKYKDVEIYTGEELRNFVISSGVMELNKRDFVNGLIHYCTIENLFRAIGLSGLRGTGKTTGLLQCIGEIEDYTNTVFITIDTKKGISCDKLKDILYEIGESKKYIFIDEITSVTDFVKGSGFIGDILTIRGIKVILSGTDSYVLELSRWNGLYHRISIMNITSIMYEESLRTSGYNLINYLKFGGLYQNDRISSIGEVSNYINTAIVDNIMNTIMKNKDVTHTLELKNLTSIEIRTIVVRAFYLSIFSIGKGIRINNFSRHILLFDTSFLEIDIKEINQYLVAMFGIKEEITIEVYLINQIINILIEMGILSEIENISNRVEKKYYITNPSMSNAIYDSIVSYLNNYGATLRDGALDKKSIGFVLESVIINHLSKESTKYGFKVYYYNNENKEIDVIVVYETDDGLDDRYALYEIKLTTDIDTAVFKSKWITDQEVEREILGGEGVVAYRCVVYMGEDSTFQEFSREIRNVSNEEVYKIEIQNRGIEVRNAENFLLNIKTEMIRLRDFEITI